MIVADAQDGIANDLVDIDEHPGSDLAADKTDPLAQKHLEPAMGHVAEVQTYLLLLVQDLRNDIGGNDVRHHVGMPDFDAFRRNLHVFFSFSVMCYRRRAGKKKPVLKHGFNCDTCGALAHL